MLADEELNVIKVFDMFCNGETTPYRDHRESSYFLVGEQKTTLLTATKESI
jgi:hypothetical protein